MVPCMTAPSHERSAGRSETDFGFASVDARQKAPLVRAIFGRVAARYDLMNDLMSGGLHRLWKESLIDELRPRPAMHLLDVAGGTGDIAFRFLGRAPGGRVTVADASAEMLEVGRRRMRRDLAIEWLCADAEALPLPDRSVDAYVIAFGLRNVTRREPALAEACRVVRPGGRFLCLEFSHVAIPLLGPVYDRYSFEVVPTLGRFVAGDAEAYRYLVESIRRFPAPEQLAAMLRQAGFDRVAFRRMSGGIVALHSAWRL